MALNAQRLRAIRRILWSRISAPHTKPVYNAAADAVDALLSSGAFRTQVKAVIDTATQALPGAPLLSIQEMKLIVAGVFWDRFNLDRLG